MKKWMGCAVAGLFLAGGVVAPVMAKESHSHSVAQTKVKKTKKMCCALSTCEYKSAMEKMHAGMKFDYTGDTDLDFVIGMIPHHKGAVDMANIVLKHGKDPEIRSLAQWIITAQETEIGMMESWKRGRFNPAAPRVETPEVKAYQVAMEKMHHAMMIDYTGDADVDFVRGMIPHHQGAVDMALVELRSGSNREIHKLASDIISSQEQEIAVMKNWLEKHTPAPTVKNSNKTKKKSHH